MDIRWRDGGRWRRPVSCGEQAMTEYNNGDDDEVGTSVAYLKSSLEN